MAIKGAKKIGNWTYQYRGFNFFYSSTTKRYFKASVSVFIDGKYDNKRFATLTDAIQYIEDALNNGAVFATHRNALVITTKVGA